MRGEEKKNPHFCSSFSFPRMHGSRREQRADPSIPRCYPPRIVNEASPCPLHHAVTRGGRERRWVLCGCTPPPPPQPTPTLLLPEVSHRSAGVSDECTHAPVHLVMRRRKDQERSRLRASFSAAVLRRVGCNGGGGGVDRLQWWLIYRI